MAYLIADATASTPRAAAMIPKAYIKIFSTTFTHLITSGFLYHFSIAQVLNWFNFF